MWSERHSSNRSQSRNPSNLDAASRIIADISLRLFWGMSLMLILLKKDQATSKLLTTSLNAYPCLVVNFPAALSVIVCFFFLPPFTNSTSSTSSSIYLWVGTSSLFIRVTALTVWDPSRLSPLCVILPPPWHLCFWMSIIALICHLLAPHMKEKSSWFAILRDCFSYGMWKL